MKWNIFIFYTTLFSVTLSYSEKLMNETYYDFCSYGKTFIYFNKQYLAITCGGLYSKKNKKKIKKMKKLTFYYLKKN
jgi:subtilase family serine protease